jgi:two-component system LytT family response regulator
MINPKLRVVIADDERPARSFLAALLRGFEDVEIVGEAENGAEAVEIIEQTKPDLALLDWQMPAVDGLGVVRLLKKSTLPLIAFVTAYDEYAVRAFAVNAVDYLLKPVERSRLRETINRAQERLEQTEARVQENERLHQALQDYETATQPAYLERIPVRQREDIILLPVAEIMSIVADGELLCLTTARGERHVINHRLKDLAARLDPARFIRLSRGALASLEAVQKISQMPGGTYLVTLANGQQIATSRMQSRVLRDQLLRL